MRMGTVPEFDGEGPDARLPTVLHSFPPDPTTEHGLVQPADLDASPATSVA